MSKARVSAAFFRRVAARDGFPLVDDTARCVLRAADRSCGYAPLIVAAARGVLASPAAVEHCWWAPERAARISEAT